MNFGTFVVELVENVHEVIGTVLEQQVDRFGVVEFGRHVEEGVAVLGEVGDVAPTLQEHLQVDRRFGEHGKGHWRLEKDKGFPCIFRQTFLPEIITL